MKKVLVVMGSDSDLKVMEKCVDRLKSFDIPTEVRICSAHRTPAVAEQLAKNAAAEGFGVIIAAAGKAAHLGGVLAAYTTLPVIGVPMATSVMGGMDSLLSIVQMPKGIPVATVAIDGADNAAILAAQMIALTRWHRSSRSSRPIWQRKLPQRTKRFALSSRNLYRYL